MTEKAKRRDFLSSLMSVSIASGIGLSGFFGFKFVVPTDAPIKTVEVLIQDANRLSDGDQYEFRDFLGKAVLLVKRQGVVRAFSSVCPHFGCKVKWESDNDRFLCPCHIGVFDPDGLVVSGPPATGLTEFPVSIKKGKIYVTLVEA